MGATAPQQSNSKSSAPGRSEDTYASEIADLLDDNLEFGAGDVSEGGETDVVTFDDAPAPAPAKDDTPSKPEADEAEPEADDAEEGDEAADEAADEADDEAGESDDAEESDEEGIETLADLAEDYEVTEEQLLSTIKIPLDGRDPVPLSEVVRAYRDAPEAARIADEVRQEAEALRTRSAEIDRREKEGLQSVTALVDALITELEGERTDMARLEQEDKLAYLTKKDELQQKRALIARGLQRLRENETEVSQRSRQEREEFARAESRKVRDRFPEWVDTVNGKPTEAGMVAAREIDAALLAEGYTQEEIDENLIDSRQISIVWKAAQYDKQQKQTKKLGRKRLRPEKKNKTLKARSARADTGKKGRARSLQRRLARSHSDRDAVAVILDSDILD